MLPQKSNADDRKMTDDYYTYSVSRTAPSASTTTTNDTEYLNTNTDKLSIEKKRIITKQRHFLLCESCFWCASSIYLVSMDWICPVCSNNNNSNKVESIPIQNNEIYKFDYNQRYGVILEFSELVV